MITEQNIEDIYTDYAYTNYYTKPKNWDKEEQIQAELSHIAYEDSLFEKEWIILSINQSF